jgi:hypothetical protein
MTPQPVSLAYHSLDNSDLAGETGKANLWDFNTEEEYHEEKQG